MASRIREDDIAAVRERARIEEVVGDHVALRKAGVGSMKGLCPFHDERSPSFHVRPQVGLFHCFGCGEGGDVIAFTMKIDHLGFVESVERLAARVGVELRYVDDGPGQGGRPGRRGEQAGQRRRLAEANGAAEAYYREQLTSPEARPARQLLADRGFDADAAARFGVGYAPRAGDALFAHLRGRGFSDEDLTTAGLVGRAASGRAYDRFRGRLLWPIRDVTGDTLGFGARRLYDDDRIEAKYLNTPDSPLYHKAQVLYGVDLAKREISRERQAVVVEGYTDVMACHLAGITTAVATCGTAFGEDHARVLRRLLGDTDAGGEVVFTFDGDAAGRRAALRAFGIDQQMIARTSVAVEPSGKDPCDLRQSGGDQAVRDLVASRVPLFEFAIRSAIADHDLDTEEGRMAALDAAAPIVAGIKDPGLRHRYAVNLDRWTGYLDERFVVNRVARAARPARPPADPGPARRSAASDDPVTAAERAALAVALQVPDLVSAEVAVWGDEAFQAPAHRAIHEAIRAATGAVNGAAATGAQSGIAGDLVSRVRDLVPASVLPLVTELAVMDLPVGEAELPRWSRAIATHIAEAETTRELLDLQRQLNRMSPDSEDYPRLNAALFNAQLRKRALQDKIGNRT